MVVSGKIQYSGINQDGKESIIAEGNNTEDKCVYYFMQEAGAACTGEGVQLLSQRLETKLRPAPVTD